MEQAKTFTLDGTEYDIETISESAKYLVAVLNDLGHKRAKAEVEVAQMNAAEEVFIEKLRQDLQPEEVKEGDVV